MALDLSTDVPRTNPPDANYTYGSFKDSSSPGALNGTPAIAKWANDFWGFFQKLLTNAAIVPNNVPDTVLNSQYFNALITAINQRAGLFIGQIYPIDTAISNPDLVKRGFIPLGLSLTGANVTALNLSGTQKAVLTGLVADANNVYVTNFVDNTTLTTKSLEGRYEKIHSSLPVGDTTLEDQIQNIIGETLQVVSGNTPSSTGALTNTSISSGVYAPSGGGGLFKLKFDASLSQNMRTGTETRPKTHTIKNKGIFIGFNEGFLL